MLLLSLDFENNLVVVDSTEAAVPEDHPEAAPEPVQESTQADIPQDVTYNFVVLFALGIIAGLLFFSILSRKWD